MKDEMLARIREALQAGFFVPAGLDSEAGPLVPAGLDSEAGRLVPAGLDRSERTGLFAERARSSGAEVHRVDSIEALHAMVEALLEGCATVATAPGATAHVGKAPAATTQGSTAPGDPLESRLGLPMDRLVPPACTLVKTEGPAEARRLEEEALFRIDGAVTGVSLAVAETGSILLGPGEEAARLISLVSEVHIALVWPDQIVSDLLDLAPALKPPDGEGTPGNMTLISGPSKTADIEIKLVVGVHGPARLHMIIVDVQHGA